jgi:hypothetical protein
LRVEITLMLIEITLERFEIAVVIADIFFFFASWGGGVITPITPRWIRALMGGISHVL